MKKMKLKRTIAAIMSLVIVSGTAPFVPMIFDQSKVALTASAASSESSAVFDETSGTLTLSGYVHKEDVQAFEDNIRVSSVVAEPGTVLPKDCSKLFFRFRNAKYIDLHNADTSNVTDMSNMFYACESLTYINLSGFDTSKVKDMSQMFWFCESLTYIDVSGFDTSNVTDMSYMFADCHALKYIDLQSFDTTNVTNMSHMFFECFGLKALNVSTFDTSNVNDMSAMFNNCLELTALDLRGFDTSCVTSMKGMFLGCVALTNLDLSNFDTSNVTDMGGMFLDSYNLKAIDISSFDTSKVTNMNCMFQSCDSLICLDLSSFDTRKVINMGYMFHSCSLLETVYVSDKWSINSDCETQNMFYHCFNILGGNSTHYNSMCIDGEYARVDKPGQPGYFTMKTATKITAQPADYSGAIGSTAKFTVKATGDGLTYQWQYLKGSEWVNSNVTGSKTNTLSVGVTEGRNGLKYRCVVKDSSGQEVTSNAATLKVLTKITKQPVDASGAVGDTVKFTVTATGAGLTYQWQYLKGSEWVKSGLTGAKTATLSVPVTEARNGLKYRCVIKDANGKTVNTNVAALKVATKITKQPTDFSGAIGDTAKFNVTATGAGLTYQWQYDNGSGWKNSYVTGAKTSTLKVPVTASRNGLKYCCIIKDANGKTVTSTAVTLTVKK